MFVNICMIRDNKIKMLKFYYILPYTLYIYFSKPHHMQLKPKKTGQNIVAPKND